MTVFSFLFACPNFKENNSCLFFASRGAKDFFKRGFPRRKADSLDRESPKNRIEPTFAPRLPEGRKVSAGKAKKFEKRDRRKVHSSFVSSPEKSGKQQGVIKT